MSPQGINAAEIIPDIEELFGRFPQKFDSHMRAAMKKSVIDIQSEIKPRTPVFQSRLRNSIEYEIRGIGSEMVGVVGSTLKGEIYPSVMEFGRTPGKRMPPPQVLYRWVHLVLGIPNEEVPPIAFRIARAIGKKGIKGHFFMRDGFRKAKPKVIDNLTNGVRNLLKDIADGS